ncbi:MAG: hypothetical protein ACTSW5_09900 [Promethearchaeota archaeon]
MPIDDDEMPVDETLLNLAFELTDEAESYIDNGDFSEAILKFQQALDLFGKAGLDAIKFEKAKKMILKRQKKAMDLEKDEKKRGVNQNKKEPAHYNQNKNQDMVNEGLAMLEKAENQLDAGNYDDAVQNFYKASEILTQAGWNQDQLVNIQNIIKTISEMLGGAKGENAEGARQPESSYLPTFMKTDQKDIIQDAAIPHSSQPKSTQPFVPSYVKVESQQPDIIDTRNKGNQPSSSQKSQPYIPSYLKVQGEQPDVISDEALKKQTGGTSRSQVGTDYKPTFLKSGQKDYAPEELITKKPREKTFKEPYIPTFAKHEQSATQFDSKSIKNAINLVQEGKSAEFTETSDSLSGKNENSGQQIQEKISPNTPMFLIVEKRKSLEEKTKSIIEVFSKKLKDHNSALQSVFKTIDEIRDLEKDRKFNLAVAQLSTGIEKLKKISGWTDQATVLYAWLLVLKEKQRINFNPRDTTSTFDFSPIRNEFNKIMKDSLTLSSSEVTISFDDLINQELSSEQLYKSKIEKSAKIQNEISQLLIDAKSMTEKERYVEAITIYNKASLLFNSMEWYDEIKQIKEIIADLAVIRKINDQILIPKMIGKPIESLEVNQIKSVVAEDFKDRQEKIAFLEDQKGKQHPVQEEAFSLIKKAENFFRTQNYDESIGLYKKAVDLLLTVGWESQIPTIHDRISEIRHERDKFIHQVQKSYQEELDRKEETRKLQDQFQQLIQEKIDKGIGDKAQVKEELQQDYTVRKQKMENVQKQITSLLESADNYSNVHQFSQAYETIAEAKTLMLEHNWKDQLPFLENFISRIKQDEETYKKKLALQKAEEEKALRNQSEFEKFLKEQSKIIENERAEKEAKLREFQSKLKEQHNLRDNAFKFMEEAEHLMTKNEFEKSIELYERANQLFLELGWEIDINSQIKKVNQMKLNYLKHIKQQEASRLAKIEQQRKIEQEKERKKQEVQNAFQDVKSMLKAMRNPPKQESEKQKEQEKKIKEISSKNESEAKAKAKAKKELEAFRKMIRESTKKQ